MKRSLLLAVALVAAVPATVEAARDRFARVSCARGGESPTQPRAGTDAELGPLVIIGTGRTRGNDPNGYGGKGYKLPVTLPAGVTAALSVPAAARRQVGLVYTHAAQDRAWERGVAGAHSSVRFAACDGDTRTGWPGGIVVDRPRCATLVVRVEGGETIRRRVPLGRACR